MIDNVFRYLKDTFSPCPKILLFLAIGFILGFSTSSLLAYRELDYMQAKHNEYRDYVHSYLFSPGRSLPYQPEYIHNEYYYDEVITMVKR